MRRRGEPRTGVLGGGGGGAPARQAAPGLRGAAARAPRRPHARTHARTHPGFGVSLLG